MHGILYVDTICRYKLGPFGVGAAYKCLKYVDTSSPLSHGEDQVNGGLHWAALGDRMLVPLADILLTHLAR